MNMKKSFLVLLSALMVMSLLIGCGNQSNETAPAAEDTTDTDTTEESVEVTEEAAAPSEEAAAGDEPPGGASDRVFKNLAEPEFFPHGGGQRRISGAFGSSER